MFLFEKSASPNGRLTLLLSLAIHAAAVAAIFAVRYSVESVRQPDTQVQLIAPRRVPAPRKHAAVRAPKPSKIPLITRLPPLRFAPPLMAPVIRAAPPALIPAPAIAAEIPAAPKAIELKPISPPPPAVTTGVFSSAATVSKGAPSTASQVETGAFSSASAVFAQGARPVQVSASGFGDAGVASLPRGSRGAVRSSGFADAVAAPAPAMTGPVPSARPADFAQILDKPRPVYTEEARRLQIEGEVQLEVLFGASGEIRILRVVRGLGHGLDENAARAAKAIRFLPAKRDGQAVDSTALVHIIFQLAS